MKKSKSIQSHQEKHSKSLKIETFDFHGPVPPPVILEGYERISPGFADRILSMTEAELLHRRELEKRKLEADISINQTMLNDYASEVRLGQIFAFIITLALAGVGAFIVVSGYPVSGSVVSSTGIGGIVTTFILGRTRSNLSNGNDKKQKKKDIDNISK